MTAPALNGNDKAALRELDGVRSEEVAQAGVPAELPGTHAPNEEGHAFSTKSPSLGPSDEMTRNAKLATEKEHQMSLWQGIRLYPKAVLWSMLISTCIVMEGECQFSQWNEAEREVGVAGVEQARRPNRWPRRGSCVCATPAFRYSTPGVAS